ncbi:MAG: COX15/CtaA family protein [Pseudomonadota bacterium]
MTDLTVQSPVESPRSAQPIAGASAAKRAADRVLVARWLMAVAGLVAIMVLVGGATRLTDSGLSITEWKPVTGVMPPLTQEAWLEEFDKYRQIPEYQLVNKGMSLAAFKEIYYWEWGHRLLGRVIGLAFFLPFLFFLVTKRIERAHIAPLVGLFALGGLQGVIGWFMVASGLVDRVDVSQYRLALHLGMAFLVFALLLGFALHLAKPFASRVHALEADRLKRPLTILLVLVFGQIVYGGFVAGLDAGYVYATWPLMDGAVVPPGLFPSGFVALFEDRLTVQFFHRVYAYALVLAVFAFGFWVLRSLSDQTLKRWAGLLCAAVFLQAAIGIATVVMIVPMALGLAHQAGAMTLLGVLVAYRHRVGANRGIILPQHVTPAAA